MFMNTTNNQDALSSLAIKPSQVPEYIKHIKHKVDMAIKKIMAKKVCEKNILGQAIHYSIENGGKRLRSALVFATGEALNANSKALMLSSATIEFIHAFSLIHDDLPALDNDDLRRGQPACHKVFGDAIAILAGDALIALAYETLSLVNHYDVSPEITLHMIQLLSQCIGSHGMAKGEALDLAVSDRHISLHKLAHIYKLKTSYLLCASILFGAYCANQNDIKLLFHLEKFGVYLGLAFQIYDDILDIITPTEILGKPQGSDIAKHKPTYPLILGLDKSKHYVDSCFNQARKHLCQIGLQDSRLLKIAEFCLQRNY